MHGPFQVALHDSALPDRPADARHRLLDGDWSLPLLSRERLEQQVRDHHQRRTGYPLSVPARSKQFCRLSVNHLRHACTPYEQALTVQHGERPVRCPAGERRVMLRLVLSAIAHAYPHLREECERKLRSSDRRSSLLPLRDLPARLRRQLCTGDEWQPAGRGKLRLKHRLPQSA